MSFISKYIPLVFALALVWPVGWAPPAYAASNILSTRVNVGSALVQLVPSRPGRVQLCVSQLRIQDTVVFNGTVSGGTFLTGSAQNHSAFAGNATMASNGNGGHKLGAGAVLCLGPYEGPLYGVAPAFAPAVSRVFSVTETF